MCKDLCPTSCYGSFKVDGGKCTCDARKCSGNAVCNSSKKCQCAAGFSGNGLVCCDILSGFAFTDAGCVVRPVAPIAPTAIVASPAGSPTSPGTTPATPVSTPTTPGSTPTTPGAAPVQRAPVSGRREGIVPKIVDFEVLSSNLVDVSAASAKIDYKIKVNDEGSGVKSIVLRGYTQYREFMYNKTFDTPVVGTVEHTFSFPISPFVPQGIYAFDIELRDFAGNYGGLGSNGLAELNFPYDFEVVNTKSEKEPPALVGLVPITPIVKADAAVDPNLVVIFQATIAEDLAGVRSMEASFVGPNNNYVYLNFDTYSSSPYSFESVDYPLAGAAVKLNVTGSFSAEWAPAGMYNLSSFQVRDAANKNSYYYQANFTSMGLVTSFTIVR